jgi:hypothetical protein
MKRQNVKGKGKVVPVLKHHAMKTYGGVSTIVDLRIFFSSLSRGQDLFIYQLSMVATV